MRTAYEERESALPSSSRKHQQLAQDDARARGKQSTSASESGGDKVHNDPRHRAHEEHERDPPSPTPRPPPFRHHDKAYAAIRRDVRASVQCEILRMLVSELSGVSGPLRSASKSPRPALPSPDHGASTNSGCCSYPAPCFSPRSFDPRRMSASTHAGGTGHPPCRAILERDLLRKRLPVRTS
jgi:hypothetical protein